jgi:hypothetical protein
MNKGEKEVCGNCKYWQDFSDRVVACISGAKSNTERDRIELRVCRFNPPPTVQSRVYLYTDDEYSCSAFVKHP